MSRVTVCAPSGPFEPAKVAAGVDCLERMGLEVHCPEGLDARNGYLAGPLHGSGWKCDRGYRAVDDDCVAIKVPANGYLADTPYGSGWKCDRRYREVGEACVAIKIPVNGYFVDSARRSGWACDRGYRAAGEACVAVMVPENAHLDYSGNDWECNRPYYKQEDGCALL